jgi:hypothetical protein
MKNNLRIVVSLMFAGSILIAVAHAQSCSGVLDEHQAKGFDTFFSPTYSPSLSTTGPSTTAAVVKRLSQDDMKRLNKTIPIVVQKVKLSDQIGLSEMGNWHLVIHSQIVSDYMRLSFHDALPSWVAARIIPLLMNR